MWTLICIMYLYQIQLVHVPLSSWHNAVLGTQLGKVCYYSITHSSASSQASHVSPALDRLPALPLQVWLTGFVSVSVSITGLPHQDNLFGFGVRESWSVNVMQRGPVTLYIPVAYIAFHLGRGLNVHACTLKEVHFPQCIALEYELI